ncbi:MAG: uroporphyrinogen decarboxylase family protein [Candidatus Bathyarchaeia archaeon]|jgi:uroporphyrinogen-III decarboxylase
MDGGKEGTKELTPRERLLKTLAHEEPDRIPVKCIFHRGLYYKLKRHFGVSTNAEVRRRLGIYENIDAHKYGYISVSRGPHRCWRPTPKLLDFYSKLYPPDSDPDYTSPVTSETYLEYVWYEEWGIERSLGVSQGNNPRSYFFTRHPLADTPLDEFEFPDNNLDRFDVAKTIIKDYKDNYVILGLIWGPFWAHLWQLRGMFQLIRDFYTNPQFITKLLDRELRFSLEHARILMELGADGVLLDDDWGTENGTWLNPTLWRKYVKPRFLEFVSSIRKRGGIVFFHTDGNVNALLPDIVESGVDVLNPVQPECMDPVEVRRLYGDKISLMTGIGVQRTLPYGTVQEVKNETINAIKLLAPGGGFGYGTAHEAREECPVANIIALCETMQKYGRYPIART